MRDEVVSGGLESQELLGSLMRGGEASGSWEKPHILYGNFLDFIRYLVVWQPLIIAGVQFVNHLLGLE
ncbi:hypothetical protein HPB48_018377 [Haemaphysalis longicornis]|uniref:Uncharacterized protein n=1 Tax=Haemaphysalis longicornis TaxID=44386 RepID=A0A9J6GG40_HAELO|nr:hypothetical protein HPB48_018377 [Haemaphysalis longicornis]